MLIVSFLKILQSAVFVSIFFSRYYLNIVSLAKYFISKKILEKIDINK